MRASSSRPLLNRDELSRIADACTAIGNEVADESGFVPIRNLLARFHANLLIRPLLVEGMLASTEHGSENNLDAGRWSVLLDSETYQISEMEVKAESQERPLPCRLRNTVAHELVHSLAFRPSEFGIRLRMQTNGKENQNALVQEIEKQTEQFSPLLLWSEKALAKLLSDKKHSLSVEDLTWAYRSMGISRYVMINRLRLIRPTNANGFRYRDGLKNLAIGIGEWVDGKSAFFKGWPLFFNFDRNIVPAFLLKLTNQDRLPAKAAIPDETFAMCGGSHNSVEFVTDAGSSAMPTVEKMKVRCSIEHVEKKPRSEFLFVIHK